MNSLKSKLIFLFSFIILFFPQFSEAKDIKIIYTGYMRDVTKTEHGSYGNLSTLLKHYRTNNDVLFLFGGNSLGPSIISNMDKGAHIIDLLNSLEPDAYGVSDSEFTYSVEEFSLCAEEAVFPFISTNAFYQNGTPIDGTVQNFMVEKSGTKIGVISILDKKTIDRYALENITIKDVEKSIEKNAKALKKRGAKIVILLKTNYVNISNEFLDNHIVDLIFSKNPYPRSKVENKQENNIILEGYDEVAVVSTHKKNNGNFEFSVKKESLLHYDSNPKIDKIISSYEESINMFLNEQIGTTNVELCTKRSEVRSKENIFGNFVTDAMKDYAKADIAIINGGIIRGDKTYKKGHIITRKDIFAELPFRNKTVLLEIKGENVLKALENGLSRLEEKDGRFLHVSGIQVIYDTSLAPNKRIKKVLVGDKELQKDKIYKLTTSDFAYKGGDDFDMLKDSKQIKSYNLSHRFIYDIVINYLSDKKIIDLDFEGRIRNLAEGK